MRRLHGRFVAVLCRMPLGAGAAGASRMRALRVPWSRLGPRVRRMPARAAGELASAVPVRRSRPDRDPPPEILRMARRCVGLRRGHGGGGDPGGRRRHLGAVVQTSASRARLRSSARSRRGDGTPTESAGGPAASSAGSDDAAGPQSRERATHRRPQRVRAGAGCSRGSRLARRRRAHDRGDARGVCRGAGLGWRSRGSCRHGRPIALGAVLGGSRLPIAGRREPPVGSRRAALQGPARPAYPRIGPTSGSVVARGTSSVVDASRGRNDPRKATVGR